MTKFSNPHRIFLSLVIIIFSLSAYSCKDDESIDPTNNSNCILDAQLIVIGTDSSELTAYGYDSSGRPLGDDLFINVSYPSSNEIVYTGLDDEDVHYFIGSNGYPESGFKTPVVGAANDSSLYSFTYNADDRITEMLITNGLEFANVLEDVRADFTYQNGNLSTWTLSIVDPELEIFSWSFEYGNDDLPIDFNVGFFPIRAGVLDYLPGLNLYGTPIEKLPISRSDGVSLETFEYEFDENGFVEHFTVLEDGTKQEEKWYSYSCN